MNFWVLGRFWNPDPGSGFGFWVGLLRRFWVELLGSGYWVLGRFWNPEPGPGFWFRLLVSGFWGGSGFWVLVLDRFWFWVLGSG